MEMSGHGGRLTMAAVARIAAANPVSAPINVPMNVIRPRSTAGSQVGLPSWITKTPTGLADTNPPRLRTLLTVITVDPSLVCWGAP